MRLICRCLTHISTATLIVFLVLIPYDFALRSGVFTGLISGVSIAVLNKFAFGLIAISLSASEISYMWQRQVLDMRNIYSYLAFMRRPDIARANAPVRFWGNIYGFAVLMLWGILEIASAFIPMPFPVLFP